MNRLWGLKPNCCQCTFADFAKVFTVAIFILAISSIVIYSIDLYRQGHKKHLIGWISAGGFVLLTIPVSVGLAVQHLRNWHAPNLQKFVVRIIWIIPIYSIESWIALRYTSLNVYMETLREFYESYAVFNFLYYLISLFGDEQNLINIIRSKPDSRAVHPYPVNLLIKNWTMGSNVLHHCKLGVLQYVAVKFLITIISMILENYDLYCEGSFRLDRGYVYICCITNASQIWALYCLILFYSIAWEELTPWRPVSKFLCVKSVVFFTWWQSIAINLIIYLSSHTSLSYRGVHMVEIKGNNEWSQRDIAKAIQDYLICIEMFVAAIGFTFAFPVSEYKSKHSYNNSYSVLPRKGSDSDVSYLGISTSHGGGTGSTRNFVEANDNGDLNDCDVDDSDGNGPLLGQSGRNSNGGLASRLKDDGYRSASGRGESGDLDTDGSGDSPESKQASRSRRPFLSALLASASPDEFLEDMRRFLGGQELSSILNTRDKSTLAHLAIGNSGEKTPLTGLMELKSNSRSIDGGANEDEAKIEVDSASNYGPC